MAVLPLLSILRRNLLHKERAEQELPDELQAYLELLAETKIRDGLEPAEAHRAAVLEVRGVEQVKECVREVRMGHRLTSNVRP